MNSVATFVVSKLKEGSTWAGIATLIAGASFIPHAQEIGGGRAGHVWFWLCLGAHVPGHL